MGDKSIKNTQVKKKKKSDIKPTSVAPLKTVVTQPVLITKKKKDF